MALRGGPAIRMQGNALGGILRELDRRSRPTTRRKPQETVEGPRGKQGERGPQGPPGKPAGAAAVVVTGKDGRAYWEYPEPFAAAPVLTAVAVDPDPDGETTVVAVLEEAGTDCAVVRVWTTRPRRAAGVVKPVGAGVQVHVTAMPRT